jgi:hypothetical protein
MEMEREEMTPADLFRLSLGYHSRETVVCPLFCYFGFIPNTLNQIRSAHDLWSLQPNS